MIDYVAMQLTIKKQKHWQNNTEKDKKHWFVGPDHKRLMMAASSKITLEWLMNGKENKQDMCMTS